MKKLAVLAVLFLLLACGEEEVGGPAASAVKTQGIENPLQLKNTLSAQLQPQIAARADAFKAELARISFETTVGRELYKPNTRNRVYLESQLNYTVRQYQNTLADDANDFLDAVELAASTNTEKDAHKLIAALEKEYNQKTEAKTNLYKTIYENVFLNLDLNAAMYERAAAQAAQTLKTAPYKKSLDELTVAAMKETRSSISPAQRALFAAMAAQNKPQSEIDSDINKAAKAAKSKSLQFDAKLLAHAAKERLEQKYGADSARWTKYMDAQAVSAVYKATVPGATTTLQEEISKIEEYIEKEIKKRK